MKAVLNSSPMSDKVRGGERHSRYLAIPRREIPIMSLNGSGVGVKIMVIPISFGRLYDLL